MKMTMLRAFAVPGVLGLLAGAWVAASPAVGAAVPGCTVINPAGHAHYTSLPIAVGGAGSGVTLLVAGTCTGTTTVSQNLTITALFGPGSATLNGDEQGTVLTISNGATVTLNGLTITGGSAGFGGGGITNYGTLTLDNTVVTGNTAEVWGGGIWNEPGATLTLGGLTSVSHNTAEYGAGFINAGDVTLDGLASVSDNTASYEGGGIDGDGGTVTIGGLASVSHNTAELGGGIFNYGIATIGGSARVTGNTAQYGGGIFNDRPLTLAGRATVSFNTATGGAGSGGGIYEYGGTVTGAMAGFAGNVFGNKPDDVG